VQGPPDGGSRPTAVAAAPVSISPPVASPQAPAPGIASIGLSAPPLQSTPPPPAQPTRSERLAGLANVAAAIRGLDEGAAPAAGEQPRTEAVGAPASSPAAQASPTLLAKRTEIPSAGANNSAAAKPAPRRRIWVQLGGKPDEAALKAEFQRLKGRAPDLLGDKAAWAAPAGATSSRLLVGPFKTQEDADLFVGLLDDQGLRATAWTSQEGQEIVKLAAK
jgi:hypothetical protein